MNERQEQSRSQCRLLVFFFSSRRRHTRCVTEIERIDAEIAVLKEDIMDIQKRIDERHQYDGAENGDQEAAAGNKRLPNESQRDFLIRTGKITPFSQLPTRGTDDHHGDLTEALMDAEEEAVAVEPQITE